MQTLENFKGQLAFHHIDTALVQNPSAIAYLTGFHSDPHERLLLLIVPQVGQPILILPALDLEMAKASTQGLKLIPHLDSQNPWDLVAQELQEGVLAGETFAIDKNYATLKTGEALKTVLPDLKLEGDCGPIIEALQLIKTPAEIALMKEAGKTADLAIRLGVAALKEGISEAEVVAEIEYQLKKQNVSKMSFDTMILNQVNAANPHGFPGNNKIGWNEFVLMDLGTMHQGYASDITRTVFFGDQLSQRQKEVYQVVLKAHDKAAANFKLGMSAGDLDKIARDVIEEAGFGPYFTHRLGHGIGATVHEFPSIAAGNDFLLQEGMCFSIEPGIYIPNEIGIRIEDCYLVTKDGLEPFTHSSYALDYKDYLK